jgi:hypothetical protein
LIHLKLHKSEVARRVDDESFRITENTEKTLVFEVYAGCSGARAHMYIQASSIIGCVHEGKALKLEKMKMSGL